MVAVNNKSGLIFVLLALMHNAHGLFDYDRAINYAQKGDLLQSKELLKKVVTQNPDNPDVLYDSGVNAYQNKEYDKALAYFNNAAQKTSNNSFKEQALFNSGNTHVQLKQLQQAIGAYDTVLTLNPNNQKAAHNKEIVKKMLEQQQEQNKENQDQQNQDKENKDNKDQENKDNKSPKKQEQKDNQEKKEPNQDNKTDKDKQQQNESPSENKDKPAQNKQEQKQEEKEQNKSQNTEQQQEQEKQQQERAQNDQKEKEKKENQSQQQKKEQQSQSPANESAEEKKQESKGMQQPQNPQEQQEKLSPMLARILEDREKKDAQLNKNMLKALTSTQTGAHDGFNCW